MTQVKYATVFERLDTHDLFISPGKQPRTEEMFFDGEPVETERVGVYDLPDPMSKSDALDFISENNREVVMACLPEHYLWRNEGTNPPTFGCRHVDEETNIDMAPNFCPFCGIGLGGEDIWDRDWPDGWVNTEKTEVVEA